jgi:hypothetical protein
MIHIFCAGIDANDNNVYDEGEDEKPSWWTYDPAGSSVEPTKVKEFDNYFVSPFKPTVDTVKGYTTVILPFAASKTDGEFTGNGFVQGFQTKTFVSAFKVEVTNGEYLSYERQLANTISVVRVNGNDSLIVKNELNNKVDAFELNGDVIEYVTFFDEDDSQYFAPLYFHGDSSYIAVYELDKDLNVNFLFNDDKGLWHLEKSSVINFSTDGRKIYFTRLSDRFTTVARLNSEKNDFDYIVQSPLYNEEEDNFNFSIGLSDEYLLISKRLKSIAIQKIEFGKGVEPIEMHYSQLEFGYMSTYSNKIYCATISSDEVKGGHISIYDFTNELNKDSLFNDLCHTGYQPLDLFPYGEHYKFRYYSVCLGIDNNFDGVFNSLEGDLPPTIRASFIYYQETLLDNPSIEMILDFPINYPLNTNISTVGYIPIPSGNLVNIYSVEDRDLYYTIDAEKYVSCTYMGSSYLVMGLRDIESSESFVYIRNDKFPDLEIEVSKNVSDLIAFQKGNNINVLTVSEGTFGESDAKINLIISDPITGEKTNTVFDAGSMGSAVVANSDFSKAAIVMSGSHEIHIFDLNTKEIILTFPTGTSGYGGPRDAEFYNNRLYVTTYSNQIIVYDENTGEKLSSIIIDGNSEGLDIYDNDLFVTNNQYSNYQPSNRIFAFDLDKITSVEGTVPTQQTIRVYPNPVANDFHLVSDDLAGTNDIAIINSQGKIVATHSGSSNGAIALNADVLGLTSGNYTALINGTRAVRFVVIK